MLKNILRKVTKLQQASVYNKVTRVKILEGAYMPPPAQIESMMPIANIMKMRKIPILTFLPIRV